MLDARALFWFFAGGAVLCALVAITRRDSRAAVVWLGGCLGGLTGCYVVLSATFLAAMSAWLYAGTIVGMLVVSFSVRPLAGAPGVPSKRGGGGVLGLGLVAVAMVGWVFQGTLARQTALPPSVLRSQNFGSALSLGRMMLSKALFGAEVLAFLMLVAVVGVMVVLRRTSAPGVRDGSNK